MNHTDNFKVDFIVPGFSKCGTTTLCDLLAQHPQIFMPQGDAKEPLYFILDDYKHHFQTYQQLFSAASKHQLIGEGSTFYSIHQFDKISCDRILEHNPDIKLIFIARDPIKRIESSFREFHHSGHKFAFDAPFDFAEAIDRIPALIEDTSYWSRLSAFRERIPDSQILVILLEDLRKNPLAVLKRCYTFLGVDESFVIAEPTRHLNDGEQKLYDTKLLRWLRHFPPTSRRISRICPIEQDKLFRKLGLRKPFNAPIKWEPKVREKVQARLEGETMAFLKYAGAEKSIWQAFFDNGA